MIQDFDIHLRPASAQDRQFLYRYNELTDLWRDLNAEHSSWFDADTVRYVDDWDAEIDGGIIAMDGQIVIGAAWLRHFKAAAPGWGFVDEKYPEVAIALEPEYTNHGIGSYLMGGLLQFAKANGEPGVSLSVENGNERAYKSYLKSGFSQVGRSTKFGYVMLITF